MNAAARRAGSAHRLRAGDVVKVRSEEEILATLDAAGCLERLPFMPEMLRHAGEVRPVFRRADKTCDSIWSPGMRSMPGAVFLSDLRCDGSFHGGCQAGCLFFWKEAWLVPAAEPDGRPESSAERTAEVPAESVSLGQAVCTRADLVRAAMKPGTGGDADIYMCQATEIGRATEPLPDRPAWDVRQYAGDVRSGNAGIRRVAIAIARAAVSSASHRLRRSGFGRRVAIPVAQRISGVRNRPGAARTLDGSGVDRSPALNLKAGDRVRVRARRDIQQTLDANNRNRGLAFNNEMDQYCGGEYRVLRRVERIINEPTGRMVTLKDDIVLEEVTCRGDFHTFCPRAVYHFWREAWLEKLD